MNGSAPTTNPAGAQGNAVSSVFGRTGAVVAASNDYTEAQLSFSDITTNNVSTSKHGFTPKLPNDATKYLDGTGAYSVPAGGGIGAVLFDSTLGSAATNIDTGASGIAGGYHWIEFRLLLRTDEVVTRSGAILRFNNDSAGNYDVEQLRGLGTGVASAGAVAQTGINMEVPGASASANYAAPVVASMPAYTDTTFYKSIQIQDGYNHGTATSNFVSLYVGSWRNTGAVTRASVTAQSAANLITGSRMMIVGW